jgi:hypothetical protein
MENAVTQSINGKHSLWEQKFELQLLRASMENEVTQSINGKQSLGALV